MNDIIQHLICVQPPEIFPYCVSDAVFPFGVDPFARTDYFDISNDSVVFSHLKTPLIGLGMVVGNILVALFLFCGFKGGST